MGAGLFDSNIDIIAQSENSAYSEEVTNIYCGKDYPEIDSHHDIILSSVALPLKELRTSMR